MSRSFETEYRNYICADLPDLWDRIEAKLDEQEAAKKTNVTEFAKPEKDVKPARKKTKIRWQYFGAAAAAAVCLMMAIPVIRNMQGAQTTAPQNADHAGSIDTTEAPDTLGSAQPVNEGAYYGTTGSDPVPGAAGEILGGAFGQSDLKSTNSSDVSFKVVGNNKVSVWVANSDSRGSKSNSTYYTYTYSAVWDAEKTVHAPNVLGSAVQPESTGGYMAQADTASDQSITLVVAVKDGTDKDEVDQVLTDLHLYMNPAIRFELKAATGDEKGYGQYTVTMSGNMTKAQLSDLVQSVCEIIGKHDFVTMIYKKNTTMTTFDIIVE